eukprot:PITA_03194
MDQVWAGLLETLKFLISDEIVNKIADTVFDKLTAAESRTVGAEKTPAGSIEDSRKAQPKKKTLNYSQLHEAIAAVFEKINETIPGANWVPPPQEVLNKMESDKDQYQQIDRKEFGEHVRKYCGHLAASYRRNVLIGAVAVPVVATLTKEIIVTVGNLLAKVPSSVLFVTLALAYVIMQCRPFNKTARKPNVISNR